MAARTSAPTNKALIERVKGDVDKLKQENPSAPVPMDSGNHARPAVSTRTSRPRPPCSRCPASPRRATCPRIAVRQLVGQNVEGRTLGLLGEPRVNVLALNMALDRAATQ